GSHADGTGFLLTSYRRERSHQRCLGSILHLQSHCAHNVCSRPCAYLFSAPAYDPLARLDFSTRVVFSTGFPWPKAARCKRSVLGSCGRAFDGRSLFYRSLRVHSEGRESPLIHRTGTLLHILASRNHNWPNCHRVWANSYVLFRSQID